MERRTFGLLVVATSLGLVADIGRLPNWKLSLVTAGFVALAVVLWRLGPSRVGEGSPAVSSGGLSTVITAAICAFTVLGLYGAITSLPGHRAAYLIGVASLGLLAVATFTAAKLVRTARRLGGGGSDNDEASSRRGGAGGVKVVNPAATSDAPSNASARSEGRRRR